MPDPDAESLREVCTGLTEFADGIWYTGSATGVSFTRGGHAELLQVEDHSFWYRHRTRCIATAIGRFPPVPGGFVFDIGGGNGAVTAQLERLGIKVVLVEPGPEGARNARKKGIRYIICGTMEQAKPIPEAVSAIGMFDVLEHIEDDYQYLEKLQSSLRPGSLLYLTVPACPTLWSGEDIYAGHYRRYTLESLREVLEHANFKIEFASHFFRWLPVPIFLLRALPFRLGYGDSESGAVDIRAGRDTKHAWINRAIDASWSGEVGRIQAGSAMRIGSSIIAVASARKA